MLVQQSESNACSKSIGTHQKWHEIDSSIDHYQFITFIIIYIVIY